MTEQKENRESQRNSWLEERLARLNAVYRRFGREGLRDHPLQDINLLLWAKELEHRDAPKGRDQPEAQKAENRLLELEIKDLTSHLNAYLASASFPGRKPGLAYPQHGSSRERQGEREYGGQERDRGKGR